MGFSDFLWVYWIGIIIGAGVGLVVGLFWGSSQAWKTIARIEEDRKKRNEENLLEKRLVNLENSVLSTRLEEEQ